MSISAVEGTEFCILFSFLTVIENVSMFVTKIMALNALFFE